MIQKILGLKSFSVICALLICSVLQSCYSNFTIKESIDQNLLKGKDITKIKLKDGREIVFDGSNRTEFTKSDSLLIKSSDGTHKMIALNLIDTIYESKLDEVETFYTIFFGSVALYYVLHNFGIIKWLGKI